MNILTRFEKKLSAFEVLYIEERANYRLLFGCPDNIRRINRQRSIAMFPPNRVAGYLRWRANEFGTQVWRCFVVRTASPGDAVTRIHGVNPGATLLLSTRGKTFSKRFLTHLDVLKKREMLLEHIPDSYWRQLQLRLHLNLDPHPLSDDQWSAGRAK
ncbi:MAG: DUF2840 domain-containing protein [Marinicaulis sp.]|nr:DUF2840 domain-containing protein [Marinicaulis sp.]